MSSALGTQHTLNRHLAQPSILAEYEDYVLDQAPLAYWKMNDASGLPQDVGGGNYDMTAVSGSPTYQQSQPFEGAYSIMYPSAAYHERAIVSTLANNFAWEAWVKRVGNTSGTLFQHGTTSGGWLIEFTSTAGAMRGNLPGVGTLGGLQTLADNTWYHLVVMRNGGTWQQYANGVVSSSSFGTAAPATAVGNDRIRGAGATGLYVAQMAYYDRVLSPLEIAARYLTAVGQIVRRT